MRELFSLVALAAGLIGCMSAAGEQESEDSIETDGSQEVHDLQGNEDGFTADDANDDLDIDLDGWMEGSSESAASPTACSSAFAISSVSASTNDGNVPANVLDNNFSTRWSGYGRGAYITANLGATQAVCGVRIAWYQGNVRTNNFTISVSGDGSSFTTVFTGKSSGTTTNYESYAFASASARYVRVTVNGNSQNDWASITELRVDGAGDSSTPPPGGNILLSDTFTGPDGLITNEYAYWNSGSSSAVTSPVWEMDSGSLFRSGNMGWTGVPDEKSVNSTSSTGNNSAVFRLNTKADFSGNVSITFDLLNNGLMSFSNNPATDWDGVHIFLRYQSQYHLYYASINRRDNTCIIKKKVPGGSTNGGTYYNLSSSVSHKVPYNSWQKVKATVVTNSDKTVTIKLYANDALIVSATDKGTGGSPITAAGATGIRGDNCNFKFDNFTVTQM